MILNRLTVCATDFILLYKVRAKTALKNIEYGDCKLGKNKTKQNNKNGIEIVLCLYAKSEDLNKTAHIVAF